jgi:hypothetical protein
MIRAGPAPQSSRGLSSRLPHQRSAYRLHDHEGGRQWPFLGTQAPPSPPPNAQDQRPAERVRCIAVLASVTAGLARAARTVAMPAAPRTLTTAAACAPQAFVALERAVDPEHEPDHRGEGHQRRPPRALEFAEDHRTRDHAEFRGLKQVKTSAGVGCTKPGRRPAGRDAEETMEGGDSRSTVHVVTSAANDPEQRPAAGGSAGSRAWVSRPPGEGCGAEISPRPFDAGSHRRMPRPARASHAT